MTIYRESRAVPEGDAGSAPSRQASARKFVYGPGEGGVTVEYLYESDRSPDRVLLTRQGNVKNLGNLEFEFAFDKPLDEYEVAANVRDKQGGTGDAVVGAPVGTAAKPIRTRMKTTYLSSQLWIVRDVAAPDNVVILARSQARSVADRRGLIIEGQLKPPEQDQIRFGGLLFSEKQYDFQGWEEQQREAENEKNKLFGSGR
jgi:hypothetical protein